MASAFRIEERVSAPRETVWRALTEPEEIRRWFGWDYDGLDEEIRFIFADSASPTAPDRIDFGDGQAIELEEAEGRTVVRAIRPGDPDEGYDGMAEGWRQFFAQLRYALERHPREERRTVRLTGQASAVEVLAAVEAELPGELWHEGRFQRGIASERLGGTLTIVASEEPLDSPEPASVSITFSSYEADDEALAPLRDIRVPFRDVP